ncbi:MAG: hypothetical protein UY40_C0006G0018 [candidate division CPR1 bacterium GW2011_GWC1_49_13]|uniref:Uncharacterized protein n=1 Tax=candidate division CPR1 bacterium GW2011_GWC1_49_13 TaxID=1618342 RepID=A0A0G1YHP4_9BACT|nr:MAG: hypothetical protein UY40_C0006G0018 [candidate division CPR1 bacterium GW2011_GWC1_49_13]
MKSPILRLIAGFISLLVIAGIVVEGVFIWEFVTTSISQFMVRFPVLQSIADGAFLLLIVVLLSYAFGELIFKPRVKK